LLRSESSGFRPRSHDGRWLSNRVAGDRDVVGTPGEVIEQIRRYQELTRCEYFLGLLGDEPDQKTLSEALELFGREVTPAFT
jgi:alkanesulfonate monooxygenase SsuD/methylene tetrahydromethanopterin reductase-like flavin-dependent oxidoreductase (luciferase family)